MLKEFPDQATPVRNSAKLTLKQSLYHDKYQCICLNLIWYVLYNYYNKFINYYNNYNIYKYFIILNTIVNEEFA